MLSEKEIILLVGCPGSGKTTAAKEINNDKVSHYSIGEMYRAISEEPTETGLIVKNCIEKGQVVPINIAASVIEGFIQRGKEKVIIDGYPRDIEQALALEQITNHHVRLKKVIEILVDRDIALSRIKNRKRGIDDDPRLFNERMNVYEKEIQEIRDFYSKKGIYETIDGNNTPTFVAEAIREKY